MAETVEAVETVKADAPKEVTLETMAARLEELQKNHETISEEMQKLEVHRQKGSQTLLVLSGAIQMLQELSGLPTTTPE